MRSKQNKNEALDGQSADDVYAGSPGGQNPVSVSGIVDPNADSSVPVNPAFRPQDKVQFQVAVKNLIDGLPDEKMSRYYDVLKSAIEEDEKEMNKMSSDTQAETVVRNQIRKVISEMFIDPDAAPGKDEATFDEIAQELGFSVAGAKQAVDKAISKAQWLGSRVGTDDFEILVLTAMKDYINHLNSSGELSDADVRLMLDHPDIVRELDGFREFLHNYIRRSGYKHGNVKVEESAKGHKPSLQDLVKMLNNQRLNDMEASAYSAAAKGQAGDDNSAYDVLFQAAQRRGLLGESMQVSPISIMKKITSMPQWQERVAMGDPDLENDRDVLAADILYKAQHGWSEQDIIDFVTSMEEFSPGQDEEQSLQRIDTLQRKYERRGRLGEGPARNVDSSIPKRLVRLRYHGAGSLEDLDEFKSEFVLTKVAKDKAAEAFGEEWVDMKPSAVLKAIS